MGGMKAEVSIIDIMTRRLTLTGSPLRPRSNVFKGLVADEIARTVWPMLSRASFVRRWTGSMRWRMQPRPCAHGGGGSFRQDRAEGGGGLNHILLPFAALWPKPDPSCGHPAWVALIYNYRAWIMSHPLMPTQLPLG